MAAERRGCDGPHHVYNILSTRKAVKHHAYTNLHKIRVNSQIRQSQATTEVLKQINSKLYGLNVALQLVIYKLIVNDLKYNTSVT